MINDTFYAGLVSDEYTVIPTCRAERISAE